jgi:3-deoxy-manno-octulosonate cytidylyltransferase (CMP-KDO synthetase)
VIGGKPMVVRVCERAQASGAAQVAVATDDERIAQVVRAAGYTALMTRADHVTGTDRLAEAASQLGLAPEAIVVNVQGDEPLIDPALIAEVAQALAGSSEASMSTACHEIHDAASLDNSNVVKVVLDARGYALYFSRSRIPFPREGNPEMGLTCPTCPTYRHLGIYAYRAGFLAQYANLAPSPLERLEALEQLRVLWHGYRIAVAVTDRQIPPGVDTPEDLEAVRKLAVSCA